MNMPVYGRGRGLDLAGPAQRYLLGRQPPGLVAPVQPAVALPLLLSLHLSSFLSGGPSALASGKEFSNSSGRVRMSSRTKLKCSDELANQPAGEAYEQQVKTPRKEPDGTGEVL